MIEHMQEIELKDNDISFLFILHSKWENINEALIAAGNNPVILLDEFSITEEKCNNLAQGIADGTACVVSDGSFNQNSPCNKSCWNIFCYFSTNQY